MTANPDALRGACDCHMHFYDTAVYPLAPTATFEPPHATVAAYREVQEALGLERVVLIQPTGYGFDNRCMLDALPQFGTSARAVVVVPPDTSDAEFERLHTLGVRGVRYMMIDGAGGVLGWDSIERMAERIAPLGWHIDLQLDGRELPQRRALIDRLPGTVVIDHTGKFIVPVGVHDPAFQALLAVLDRGDRWVKLSAPYETSKSGPPFYDDVAVLARALLAAQPERCLWASNWPHPNRRPVPSDAAIAALRDVWLAQDGLSHAGLRERVLVTNPARLYGFDKA